MHSLILEHVMYQGCERHSRDQGPYMCECPLLKDSVYLRSQLHVCQDQGKGLHSADSDKLFITTQRRVAITD
mgnify:CR=1 FL=1